MRDRDSRTHDLWNRASERTLPAVRGLCHFTVAADLHHQQNAVVILDTAGEFSYRGKHRLKNFTGRTLAVVGDDLGKTFDAEFSIVVFHEIIRDIPVFLPS